MSTLQSFVNNERKDFLVYPHADLVFKAFEQTSLDQLKCIILGQDPYHGENQANGLAFSVNEGVKLPPSLKNIFKELANDIELEQATTGNLQAWARQGVLLLNTVLTVRAGEAGSHQNQGWEVFTDACIEYISREKEHVVFSLWGKPAQSKVKLIDANKHTIVKTSHPSPLSAYRGFLGSSLFSKTNEALVQHGQNPVQWNL